MLSLLRKTFANLFSPKVPKTVANQAKDVTTWRSRFRPIEIRFSPPWTWVIPPHDVENETIIGVIDSGDGSHYTITVRNEPSGADFDAGAEALANKTQVLNADPRNRLIAESDTTFHGAAYRFIRFAVFSKERGRFCVDVYTRRSDALFIAIQMSFPIEGDRVDGRPPDKILALNRGIRVYE